VFPEIMIARNLWFEANIGRTVSRCIVTFAAQHRWRRGWHVARQQSHPQSMEMIAVSLR
jgi:hypothetical protein